MKKPKSVLSDLNLDNEIFISPNGEVVKLLDVASIRSVKVLDPSSLDDMFIVDFIDIFGKSHTNYNCTFDTLHLAIIMLFSENEKEDFTSISVNFVGLASLMIMSWFKGSNDAQFNKLPELEPESETELKEYPTINKNNLN